jgi:hypothetical protein
MPDVERDLQDLFAALESSIQVFSGNPADTLQERYVGIPIIRANNDTPPTFCSEELCDARWVLSIPTQHVDKTLYLYH